MKVLDIIAEVLLIVGGISWGFIGAVSYNPIAVLFGYTSMMTQVIYVLIGIAAIYHIIYWSAIKERHSTKRKPKGKK